MDILNFIFILILLLAIFYVLTCKEGFMSNNESGLYNYFFQSYMNPYPLALNKFFSNDSEGNINK